MTKKERFVCPKCGSDAVEIYDQEVVDNCLRFDCQCCECGKTWHEYFKLIYDGYCCDSKVYDANGNLEIDFDDLYNAAREDTENR